MRKPNGFEPIRNIAGFAENPGTYKLKASEAFTEGDPVKLDASGDVTKAANADTEILGIMAQTITAEATGTTLGRVHDNPLQVFRVAYEGTATPVAGSAQSLKTTNARVIDSDDAGVADPFKVVRVDSVNKVLEVVITKHAFK